MKQKLTCFYILLFFISIPINAGWQRQVTNYTRHVYKAGNQNWRLTGWSGIHIRFIMLKHVR